MFIYPYSTAEEMRIAVRRWNRVFSEKGLRVLPLKYNGRSALIYLYRPSMLSRDLQNKTAYNISHKVRLRLSLAGDLYLAAYKAHGGLRRISA